MDCGGELDGVIHVVCLDVWAALGDSLAGAGTAACCPLPMTPFDLEEELEQPMQAKRITGLAGLAELPVKSPGVHLIEWERVSDPVEIAPFP